MKDKVRFGVIGCSRIAENSVIPAIKQSNFAELKIIGSSRKEKAENFARKFSCDHFGSYQDVLENKEIDAVYISLPISLHEEWTIKSAEYGKHIVCEKSSTISYSAAKRMVNHSKKNQVRLMEALMFRFHPSHQKVVELINSGHLGKLFSFYGQYGFPQISYDDIRYKRELGGGVFNDAGCYPICSSRIIFSKEPIGVMCNLTMDKEFNVDTKASLFLAFSESEFAHIVVGYDLAYQNMYSLWGGEGFLHLSRAYNIPPDMQASLTINSAKLEKEILVEPANHFKLMIDAFSQEIKGKNVCGFNLEDELLKQAKVMEAARLSAKKKQFVSLDALN